MPAMENGDIGHFRQGIKEGKRPLATLRTSDRLHTQKPRLTQAGKMAADRAGAFRALQPQLHDATTALVCAHARFLPVATAGGPQAGLTARIAPTTPANPT